MTRAQALRRVRQTSTPERVVRHRVHGPDCPAYASEGDPSPMGCRCRRPRYGYSVVLDTRRAR